MPASAEQSRKCPVNLTLNEALVGQADSLDELLTRSWG